jgi:tetratricopeptide (TPR) repeat protein
MRGHAVASSRPEGLTEADLQGLLKDLGTDVRTTPALPTAELARLRERVQASLEAQCFEAAVEDAQVLVDNDPLNRHDLLALAQGLHHLGQYAGASRFYLIALVLDATDAQCIYRIGECLGALGYLSEARDAFESAIQLSWIDPGYAAVRDHARQRLDELTQLGA